MSYWHPATQKRGSTSVIVDDNRRLMASRLPPSEPFMFAQPAGNVGGSQEMCDDIFNSNQSQPMLNENISMRQLNAEYLNQRSLLSNGNVLMPPQNQNQLISNGNFLLPDLNAGPLSRTQFLSGGNASLQQISSVDSLSRQQQLQSAQKRMNMNAEFSNQQKLLSNGSSIQLPEMKMNSAFSDRRRFLYNGTTISPSSRKYVNSRSLRPLAPKPPCGSPIPSLPNLNSSAENNTMMSFISNERMVSPVTPATMEKNQRMRTQDRLPPEIIDLVDDEESDQDVQQKKSSTSQQFIAQNTIEQCPIGNESSFSSFLQQLVAVNPSERCFSNLLESSHGIPYQQQFVAGNHAEQCFSTQVESFQKFPFHQQEGERRMVVSSSQILSLSQVGGERNAAANSSRILYAYQPEGDGNVVVNSSNLLSPYHLECEQNMLVSSSENAPVQQGDLENQGIDLNKTPPQKPKRKKHRPKVIREGKPTRTPKAATPKPRTPVIAEMTGTPAVKRKYVRKKKDSNLQETPSDALGEIVEPDSQEKNKPISSSVQGDVADPENQGRKKSVRRSLNFELENSQAADGLLGSASMIFRENQLETEIRGAAPEFIATSNTTSRVQSCQQQGPTVLESPRGYSANGSKRDLNLVTNVHVSADISLVNVLNGTNRVMGSHHMSSTDPCFPEMQKKRRMENEQIRDSVSTPPSTPNCQKLVYPLGSAGDEFTFADPQRLVHEKRQALERMLVSNQAMRQTIYRPAPAHSPTSHAIVDCSNPAKCSPQLDHNQPSTPEKAAGHSINPDYEIYGPPARVDLLNANQMKSRTVKRRKKERVPLDTSISSNDKEIDHILANCKTGSSSQIKSTPRGCGYKNAILQTSAVKGYQCSSNLGGAGSPGWQSRAVVPYQDPVDYIIRKLLHLKINDDLEDAAGLSKNALVPYAGGGGVIVPFEGPFEHKRRKPRPKVDLDPESNRVWNFLMGKGSTVSEEGTDKDKEKWWEEERRVFRGRADSFIARMHLIQGDRRFSKWKGSVVDSVIGVFLTQNVSDHLSSSAFMCLAARFPPKSEGNNETVEGHDTIVWQDKMSEQGLSYQRLSGTNGSKQMVNTGLPKSCESPESSIGCVSIDYSKETSSGFHERELGIGHESPNSVLGTTVTVARCTSLVEDEDRPLEDVVALQKSLALSQSSLECQGQNHVKQSPLLNLEAEDLLNGGITNGFSSFMELLHMESERSDGGLLELNSSGNGRIPSTKYAGDCSAHLVMDNSPPVPNGPTYLSCSDPSIYTSNTHSCPLQYDFTSLSCAPPSYYHKDYLNTRLAGLEKASTAMQRSDQPQINLSASETKEANTISIMGKQFDFCAGRATNDMNQNKLLVSRVAPSLFPCASMMKSAHPTTSPKIGVATEKQYCSQSEMYSNKQCYNICKSQQGGNAAMYQRKEMNTEVQAERSLNEPQVLIQSCRTLQSCSNSNNDNRRNNLDAVQATQPNLINEACISQKPSAETLNSASKGKKAKAEETFDWDSLRREACQNDAKKARSSEAMDSLDYEAVRCADVNEISHAIRERGMNNMLAERIKDFLNRLVRDHGSMDLEWLRDVPPDKVKDYLLSIRGLGLKSVECVRLLTLHHLAFPVDTNVGRICVRLGWVPLQPLPESLQLHLLEMYPMLETIQKYLWPRLCKLDQRTLYELHYQLITFGKVFCTKSKPNCNACPMRGECKHFASAFASARLALPGPEEKSIVPSEIPIAFETDHGPVPHLMPLPQLEGITLSQKLTVLRNCEPIIEEPASPEPGHIETSEIDIEDAFYDDPEEIPTIKLNIEEFTRNLQNYMQENKMGIQDGDMSKALVAINPELASIPTPKLKNVSRLRTEHQVYELPDTHPLLEGLDKREPDDPCPYLLAIWTPGETAQSTEPPTAYCNSQETGKLCDKKTCFSCNSIREAQAQMVRGTLLIPCRTANRGSFPLNGTYFQVNEVFADHHSSRNPIDVPRDWIWNLPRRTVYFGTSIPSIFKGLTTEEIQHCFWRGFICVRGFDQTTRAPKPLFARLHIAASKVTRNRKTAATATATATARKE